jgi:hypothetical protein
MTFGVNLSEEVFNYPTERREPPLPPEAVQFPSLIDNSMMDDFRKCEQRWFYKHCRKLAMLDDNVHLIAGGAYAKGLETVRKRYFDDGWPLQDAIRAGVRALIAYYGGFEPHGRHTAKNVWRMIGALEHHFNRWPIDSNLKPFKPEGAKKHTIEFSFAEPLPLDNPDTGEPLIYSGKCDFIGFDEETGLIGPVDDKTTTQLGDYWLSKWDLNSQMFGYIWASRRAGYPSMAAFIRGISILKTRYGDAEAQTYASDEAIAKWYISLLASIKRMIRAYTEFREKDEALQMAWGGACTDFGGCGFKILCESEQPEIWIPVHYTVNRWNPLESRD